MLCFAWRVSADGDDLLRCKLLRLNLSSCSSDRFPTMAKEAKALDPKEWEIIKKPVKAIRLTAEEEKGIVWDDEVPAEPAYVPFVFVALYCLAVVAGVYVAWRLLRIAVRTLAREITAGKEAGNRAEAEAAKSKGNAKAWLDKHTK